MKPILVLLGALALAAVASEPAKSEAAKKPAPAQTPDKKTPEKLVKTEAEWKQQLTPEQFRILRQQGTERAFTGEFWDHHEDGVYKCAGCGAVLFRSTEKFDSGTGWPSYWKPAE